jgi:tetratricopeptide (TPR) repeat protein
MKNSIKISHSARFFLLALCLVMASDFVYSEAGQSKESELRSLKTELAKSPSNLKAKARLAELYFQNSQYAEVVQLLKADAELLPRASLIILGKAYGEVQDKPNQGRILEHLTGLNPRDYEAFTLLGEYFITMKQDEDAIRNLRQALNIKPNYKLALEDLLLIYQGKNNNFEMRLIYQDLIKHFGKKPEYVSRLCKIHTVDGFYDTAKKYCRAGAKIDSKNPENYLYLAYIEQSLGNASGAVKIIKTAMQRFPDSDIVLSSYAAILIRQKNFAGAEKYFLQATKINGEYFDSQIGLANSSFESKDYEISLNAYKKACKIEPHKSARELKRAANFIRYKSVAKWEDAFNGALETCVPTDYSSNKKKNIISLADLRRPKPQTPFTVPLVMDVKIAADPASLKKPDGSTIFRGQENAANSANPNGNSGTFSGSSFAPNTSPFSSNGLGAGHNNDPANPPLPAPAQGNNLPTNQTPAN